MCLLWSIDECSMYVQAYNKCTYMYTTGYVCMCLLNRVCMYVFTQQGMYVCVNYVHVYNSSATDHLGLLMSTMVTR